MTSDVELHIPAGDLYRVGFDYAWAWFELHSGQRMHLVNFWLVTVGAVTAGLAAALTQGHHGAAALVAVAGAAVTWAFRALDRRTRVLVELAERALASYEADVAGFLRIDTVRLLTHAQRSKRPRNSYRVVLGGLQLATAVVFGLVAMVCALQVAVAGGGW